MSDNLLKNSKINYIDIENMSIDYVIQNEYPIISLFTRITAQQAYTILEKIISEKLLTKFDLCLFLTLLTDAVSCLISNVLIEFGNISDTHKFLSLLLRVIMKSDFHLCQVDSNVCENMLNIMKRSGKRMNRLDRCPFNRTMERIMYAYECHFQANFSENKIQKEKFLKEKFVKDTIALTLQKNKKNHSNLIKPKDISSYFIKREILSDKNREEIQQNTVVNDEMTMDCEIKENKSESLLNCNQVQGKIFVMNDLGCVNPIPTVPVKRNAFDIMMKKNK